MCVCACVCVCVCVCSSVCIRLCDFEPSVLSQTSTTVRVITVMIRHQSAQARTYTAPLAGAVVHSPARKLPLARDLSAMLRMPCLPRCGCLKRPWHPQAVDIDCTRPRAATELHERLGPLHPPSGSPIYWNEVFFVCHFKSITISQQKAKASQS